MSVERELINKGCPIEDAITLCNSTRRTGELEDYINKTRPEKHHVCVCGGAHNCPNCPNRKAEPVCME